MGSLQVPSIQIKKIERENIMDPRIYRYAMSGDTNSMRELVKEDQLDLTLQLTLQSNNALHIVAQHGHCGFAKALLVLSPSLLSEFNSDGDFPLHVASREGHMALVKVLIDSLKKNLNEEATDLESNTARVAQKDVWLESNLKGNTALHEALRFRRAKVAVALLEFDPRLADTLNQAGESPLYLACELRMRVAVKRILSCDSTYRTEGPNGRTPLHASANSKHFGITRLLLKKLPYLIKQVDNLGMNALHYSACTGAIKISHLLVKTDRSLAYVKDSKGLSPFFVAIQSGRPRTACMILDHCPDIGEMRDTCGKNALHITITHNSLRMMKALMKRPELRGLLNKPDDDGNTPLHTATKHHNWAKVKLILDTKRVDLRAKNGEDHTALDVSELGSEITLRQILIRRFLLGRGAVRNQLQIHRQYLFNFHPLNRTGADLKSFCETMSLVAILLATISFAAAFTLPGGYNSDDPNKGRATLIKRFALKIFLLSDTITFCSSLTLAMLMTWGTLGDLAFLHSTAIWCDLLLWISFHGSLVAFGTGVYAVISDQCKWLAIVILVMVCSVPFFRNWFINRSSKMTPLAVRLQKSMLGQSMKRNINMVQNTVSIHNTDSEPRPT
ncbi:Ankyrin repeat-containing protein [Acorus calamus]|uniref:Ankyrin repeat-containing protein n=1 Tax=Acorus calamus TaxID=4465 RepID=A0AAV9E461_ACOCL|nr:Ankyrin repeat-containing protein [Acorus calamus]